MSSKQNSPDALIGEFVMAWMARAQAENKGAPVFCLDGVAVSHADAASPAVLLPLFAWHADSLFKYGMGVGLGLEMTEEQSALLGVKVSFSSLRRSTSEALLFLTESLVDIRQHLSGAAKHTATVELRGLVNSFAAAMKSAAVPGLSAAAASLRPQA